MAFFLECSIRQEISTVIGGKVGDQNVDNNVTECLRNPVVSGVDRFDNLINAKWFYAIKLISAESPNCSDRNLKLVSSDEFFPSNRDGQHERLQDRDVTQAPRDSSRVWQKTFVK